MPEILVYISFCQVDPVLSALDFQGFKIVAYIFHVTASDLPGIQFDGMPGFQVDEPVWPVGVLKFSFLPVVGNMKK